jgi:hypothetical protein
MFSPASLGKAGGPVAASATSVVSGSRSDRGTEEKATQKYNFWEAISRKLENNLCSGVPALAPSVQGVRIIAAIELTSETHHLSAPLSLSPPSPSPTPTLMMAEGLT